MDNISIMNSFSTKGGHSMDKVVKTYGLSTVGAVFMEKFGNTLGFSTVGAVLMEKNVGVIRKTHQRRAICICLRRRACRDMSCSVRS